MRKLLTILFLVASICAYATDYYVKTGGNDAAAGTSDGTAWAHHPWMSTWTGSVTLAAGDVVYMKRGDTWTHANSGHYMTVGQSGTGGNYITTTAYGTGAQPLIKITYTGSSAVVYASGKSFLKFDNLHIQHNTSTYTGRNSDGFNLDGASSPCHDIIFTNNEIDNIPYRAINGFLNCYNITIGDITATETATTTEYSNHIHHFGYAGVLLCGSNPADGHSHWDVYYNYIHDGTKTVVGDNEYAISFTANSTSYSWPRYATARYNRAENIITWEAIGCHSGSYIYFLDNYMKNVHTAFLAGGDTRNPSIPAISDHIYIERNTIENPVSQASYYSGSFIRQHSSSLSVMPTDIYIRDNIMFYTTRPTTGVKPAIRAGNVDGITISGNKIYNGPVSSSYAAIYFDDGEGKGNKNVTITGNHIINWGSGIDLWGAYIVGPLSITNNIISKPAGNACIRISNSSLPSTAALTIYNNTFLNDTYAYCFYNPYGLSSGGSVTAKNNIFGRASSGSLYYWYWGGTISGTFTSDYNLYWNSTSGSPFYQAGGARNWTYWTGTLGHDMHGLNATDPELTNAGGSYLLDTDFELDATSDAIDAGTGVGLSLDYFGNEIDGNPDIGVFEYDGSPPPPPPPTLPAVTTGTTVADSPTSATSGGDVTDDGGGTGVSARGVCYSTSINPTTADSHTSDGTGEGVFVSALTPLSEDTEYHARAYATNEIGTTYGEDVVFSTLTPAVLPTVVTISVFDISTTNAKGGGTITDDGNAAVTARGACWAETANPTTAGSHTTDGTGDGGFTSSITGLTLGTLYHVRAYATNSVGTAYGADVTFTTTLSAIYKVYFHNGKMVFKNGKIQIKYN